MADRREKYYDDLVRNRKTCYLCKDELCNPSKIEGYSKFDNDIGPWSRWQGNLYADIMIVGQDWGHRKYLYPDHEDESNPTNNNLRYLLKHGLGIEIKWNLLGKQGKLFFTNAVLCLRDNEMSMQGKPKPDWLDNCVSEKKFLRQQIEIVNPKVVVGLGRSAFESILRSFNLESEFPRSMRLSDIIQKKGIELLGTRAKAFAVYHCGARVTNTTRTIEMQVNDWQRIRNALDATK